MLIKGILFDFIGTIVMEKEPLTINRCFAQAFRDHGVMVTDAFIKANRGKDKKEVIVEGLNQFNFSSDLTEPITRSLQHHIQSNLDNFYENNGAKETIRYLKGKNNVIGVGSGLPRDTFEKIFDHLEWEAASFDYIGIAEEMGKGRPHPDMILDMLNKCDLKNTEFLKVGDTVADIQEGKNANVFTAAILSGTQDEADLRHQQPDFVIHSLHQLKEII